MKSRAYLLDDEPLALERLRRLLARFDDVEVLGSATEPEEAISALAADSVDLLFLDIQMPRLNGFEVLSRLPVQPLIIFTTAYDEYALKAFEVNSVDYLLKPIDPEQLRRALNKVARLRTSGTGQDLELLVKSLAESLQKKQPEYLERIASRLGERLRFIDLADITHFYAEDKLTYAAAEGKSYCVDFAIADLELKLDPNKFLRIHRSTIVNVSWIKEVAALPGGGLNVRLRDQEGTDLTVARDRARDFKAKLGC
ncbi:MAG TPA: LytTR family DNA-binding domain-containing protein [Terriglobales bacterium]|nr:LytTR family DNA-binding domain-containing protein [Terriglobales bacterium]